MSARVAFLTYTPIAYTHTYMGWRGYGVGRGEVDGSDSFAGLYPVSYQSHTSLIPVEYPVENPVENLRALDFTIVSLMHNVSLYE